MIKSDWVSKAIVIGLGISVFLLILFLIACIVYMVGQSIGYECVNCSVSISNVTIEMVQGRLT